MEATNPHQNYSSFPIYEKGTSSLINYLKEYEHKLPDIESAIKKQLKSYRENLSIEDLTLDDYTFLKKSFHHLDEVNLFLANHILLAKCYDDSIITHIFQEVYSNKCYNEKANYLNSYVSFFSSYLLERASSDDGQIDIRVLKKGELFIKLSLEVNGILSKICDKDETALGGLFFLKRKYTRLFPSEINDLITKLIELYIKSGCVLNVKPANPRKRIKCLKNMDIEALNQKTVDSLMEPIIDKIMVLIELISSENCTFNDFPIEIKHKIGLKLIETIGAVPSVVIKILGIQKYTIERESIAKQYLRPLTYKF